MQGVVYTTRAHHHPTRDVGHSCCSYWCTVDNTTAVTWYLLVVVSIDIFTGPKGVSAEKKKKFKGSRSGIIIILIILGLRLGLRGSGCRHEWPLQRRLREAARAANAVASRDNTLGVENRDMRHARCKALFPPAARSLHSTSKHYIHILRLLSSYLSAFGSVYIYSTGPQTGLRCLGFLELWGGRISRLPTNRTVSLANQMSLIGKSAGDTSWWSKTGPLKSGERSEPNQPSPAEGGRPRKTKKVSRFNNPSYKYGTE